MPVQYRRCISSWASGSVSIQYFIILISPKCPSHSDSNFCRTVSSFSWYEFGTCDSWNASSLLVFCSVLVIHGALSTDNLLLSLDSLVHWLLCNAENGLYFYIRGNNLIWAWLSPLELQPFCSCFTVTPKLVTRIRECTVGSTMSTPFATAIAYVS